MLILEKQMKLLVINGPNLNMLGIREPDIYGTATYADLCALMRVHAATIGVDVELYQSNHEGDLIDWVQKYGLLNLNDEPCDGIILNAGGYTHTSIALRDAIACCRIHVVEVHISDIAMREEFRRVSLLTDVCAHSIIGHGTDGYQEAVDWILNNSDSKK